MDAIIGKYDRRGTRRTFLSADVVERAADGRLRKVVMFFGPLESS